MQRPIESANSTSVEIGLRFARMATIVSVTGLCRATIYRMIADKRFPAQVRIGSRAVGWRWSDIERWSKERTSPPQ